MIQDTIPGISLDKADAQILKGKKGDDLIVAVLDTSTDIEHPELRSRIWLNLEEITNNGKDDDKNGYIDDINGWNFVGFHNGKSSEYLNYEYTRILREYDSVFLSQDSLKNRHIKTLHYQEYLRAQNKYNDRNVYAVRHKKVSEFLLKYFDKAQLKLTELYASASSNPPLVELENLYKKEELNGELKSIYYAMYLIKRHSFTKASLQNRYQNSSARFDIMLNKEYNDRAMIGDKPNDITDKKYGNNIVNANLGLLYHGTRVSGIIARISNSIEIMPLSISAIGDEHDKDIALAIRYAADNGAKIINMSSSKEFSLHQDWVQDAIRYAEQKDVLFITSAGNDGNDLDLPENFNYPNDTDIEDAEIVSNFIKVGASGYELNENIKRSNSNYGKREVDLFAPGTDIYTTSTNDVGYEMASGTSFATPIVSGIAALVRSYYPNLTAPEVKQILMDSGVEYDIMVKAPTEEDPERMLPFNQLSKSGKIVNAYNALLMAEKVSKAKKRKKK
ncbi:S8 family serine peptidase [Sungkyunkwania multivorans]|uniref:S8 family serine peptidase n=1 Tax=Sungkyunkwania multivorans TaxID=1173618 RepID=A0ABW3D0X3_9FLAO